MSEAERWMKRGTKREMETWLEREEWRQGWTEGWTTIRWTKSRTETRMCQMDGEMKRKWEGEGCEMDRWMKK